ncbi:1125_t:CDS:2 [Ambispora leptoticha]|uniref:1125_t:CDS:1 n=1 Tax=Ambispora leptoticha TaxID=144679 RepID=A0A9N9NI97_9GLOM|nr:1125_t:CDS:2 [Ambispora leptoticha]
MPLAKERVVTVRDVKDEDDEAEEEIKDDFEKEELEEQLYAITMFSEKKDLKKIHDKLGPVAGLIAMREEEDQPISDLFNYYYEKESCSNVKYNIEEGS